MCSFENSSWTKLKYIINIKTNFEAIIDFTSPKCKVNGAIPF